MVHTPNAARMFALAAGLEAISWCILLAGMYLKYGPADNPTMVSVAGPIHGTLFLVYLGVTNWIAAARSWSLRDRLIGLAAGVPPFATVIFERWAASRGLVRPAAAA